MPHAPLLLGAVVAANVLLEDRFEAALVGLIPDRPAMPLFWLVVHALIELGVLALLLRGANKSARFVQTAIALAVASLVFSLVAGSLFFALLPLPQKPEGMTAAQAMLMLLTLPLLLWFAAIRTWILHGATEYRWRIALLVALALPIAEGTITVTLMRMFE